MRVLVIGLGSMGKRRLRNLLALGVVEIAGVDVREDRRAESSAKYSVPTFENIEDALAIFKPTVVVISTPPNLHMEYAFLAVRHNLPSFVEASVVDAEKILQLHEMTSKDGPLVAPSCTMRYFPGPRKVKELVFGNAIGKVVNINYQTGQYLKDWHPWEPIENYYVSNRATGGCREIVPFELTWLNDIFGDPEPMACHKDRIGDLDVDIDDIYHFWLRYPGNVTASITVEVLSRPMATRELRVLGTTGQIVFSADENAIRTCNVDSPKWTRFELAIGQAESGYINPEEPYIAEIRDFLLAVESGTPATFPNTLLQDYKVLQTLNSLERQGV